MASEWTEKCFALRKKDGETLADLLEPALQIDPDRIAIYYEEQSISYRALDEAASRLANSLVGLGVKPGDRVAIVLPNWPEFVVAVLAASELGATIVPFHTTTGVVTGGQWPSSGCACGSGPGAFGKRPSGRHVSVMAW